MLNRSPRSLFVASNVPVQVWASLVSQIRNVRVMLSLLTLASQIRERLRS